MKVKMVVVRVEMFLNRHWVEKLTGRLFTEKELEALLTDHISNRRGLADDLCFRILDLSTFSDMMNDNEINVGRSYVVPVVVTEGQEKTWDEIKNEIHDISGIHDPYRYTFYNKRGIWYPENNTEGIII